MIELILLEYRMIPIEWLPSSGEQRSGTFAEARQTGQQHGAAYGADTQGVAAVVRGFVGVWIPMPVPW